MSPLAFPCAPYQGQQQQQQLTRQQIDAASVAPSPIPVPSIGGDAYNPPPVFVFPPISEGDRQPSPFGSDGSSVAGSFGDESSRGPSPLIFDAAHMQQYQQAQTLHYQQQQQQQFPLDCPTPTMPLMSPLVSPFFSTSMTPTFAYDSYGLYQHPQYYNEGAYPQQQAQQEIFQQLPSYDEFMAFSANGREGCAESAASDYRCECCIEKNGHEFPKTDKDPIGSFDTRSNTLTDLLSETEKGTKRN